MIRRIVLLALGAMALACAGMATAAAQQTEPRIAFVVGNGAYAARPIPTALNDAGLVAEALRSIGFEVVEGADLNQPDLLRSFREFLGKVQAAGPDTLAFVYFSGLAVAFEGDNFLLGVDAQLGRDSDIAIQGVRLSDLLRPLADTQARAKVMMIDAARELPFLLSGRAPGLEAVEPPPGMLIAFSSAPGTIAPDRPGDYGAYATAIAEMLRAPGTDLDVAFTHIRSRTHLATEGQQTPWHLSAIGEQIELVPPEAAQTAGIVAPPPPRQARPMREIDPDDAYSLAIEMDTLDGYVDFVEAYPRHPYATRIWTVIRARREALSWMRAWQHNTPQSYWTYLRRYPSGLYFYDAQSRLRRLNASLNPPQGFAAMNFEGVPVALADEPRDYRDVYMIGPPPPRILYRPPPPAFLANLAPPRRVNPGVRVLPAFGTTLVPAVGVLTVAPRRNGLPGAGRPSSGGWQGGFAARPQVTTSPASGQVIAPGGQLPGGRPGIRTYPPRGPNPNTAVAPSTVAPSTVTPNTVAPNTAAPTPVTPSNRIRPAPPPAAVARPIPPQQPVVRQALPQQQRQAAPPPPRPAAPRPPQCPPGKTFRNGVCS